MDFTKGGFGPVDDDVLAQMYANTKQAASMNYMLNDPYQYKRSSPTVDYQAPQYAMHDYGIADFMKHDVLGSARGIGTNFAQESLAKQEYRSIATKSMGMDAMNV
jgi:hypothetical protein